MNIKSLLILFSVALLWTACSDNASNNEVKPTKNEKSSDVQMVDDGTGGEFEDYMAIVDASNSYFVGSSMYYSKSPDISNENYQVYLLLDSTSKIVRIEEKYTRPEGGSILTNRHYFRDNQRIASKEIFNEGTGENEMFFERVTYYENEKPIISKKRSSRFEEGLDNELFQIITPVNCPIERAQRAIAQEDEFATNFMGVIRNDGLFYIEVGEGKPKGFSTTLLVQQITPLIQDMISYPQKYKGKKMKVDFREMPDGQGFTFQALMGIEVATK